MINSIGNQGVPLPGPNGVPGRNVSQQARGDQQNGGLNRAQDQGRGFMRGHMTVNGGDHRTDLPQLTELDKAALRLAHDAKVRYLQDQMSAGDPVKVDGARISAEGVDMLRRDRQSVGGGTAGDQPVGGNGGGAVGDQPVGGNDGGAAGGGAVADQPAPPVNDGPSGPTYTARRA